jgi:DNA-binding transcriptional regulator of glucitol operon
MERLLLAVVLVVVASAVAAVLRRRRPAPPTQAHYQVPAQLDRDDFDGRDRPWLVAVFSSQTCESCERAWAKVEVLASGSVAVQDVSYQARGDLHARYAVEAVPLILVADPEGVVRASFIGVPTATDLWAAVAEARQPGASPEPHLGAS